MTSPHRLTRKDFPAIPRDARRVSSPFFTLNTFILSAPVPARLGVIVSKKVSIRAVKRNLLRRRVRAGVMPTLKHLPKGSIVVVHMKKEALEATGAMIRAELERLLRS